MAKTDIGPKIGIEGEAQFRRELNEINQGMKTLDAEAKAVAASMQDETDAEKKSAAQKDVLERKILSQSEKLDKLKQGLEASARKYGEADTRTQKWQKAVYDATADLANMEHELKGVDSAVDEAADSMEEAESAATGWADVMKGQLAADFIKNGIKALAGYIKEASTALWDASKAGAAYADTYNTMAATTGLSTETLQEYAYMADLVDVSLETLTGTQTKLLNNMRKAKKGTGDAAETWEALGVNIKDARGHLRSAENVMNETLKALSKIENETERDAAAMAIFGRSAQELNPMIKAGADRLDELRKEAHDTGYVLSGSALTALNKQQDAMDKLGKRVEAVGNRFSLKLAPGVTKGAEALDAAFDNPRVKRGLDVLSEGIGAATSSVMDLAAQALPELFRVFSIGNIELRLFSDEQLDLVNRLEDVKTAHDEMISGFTENAKGIMGETERVQGLWAELQTLVGANGEVKKADEERVNYITSELKDALGVQMELEGGILQGYKDQQFEIDKLIKKRQAEALMAAGADAFAEAESKRNEALAVAAQLYPQIAEREKELQAAEEDLERARQSFRASPGYAYRGEAYVEEMTVSYKKAVNDQRDALADIQNRYDEAREEAQKYYADTDKWQRAQTAAANENYVEVVRILTSEFAVSLDYYREKKELSDKEKQDLRDKIRDAELNIDEYKRNLKDGLQGFSENGLKEMQAYVAEAKRILDGKAIGQAYLDGLDEGLRDKERNRRLNQSVWAIANNIDKTTRNTLAIMSPSRKAKHIGKMWDEGLIAGMEEREAELRRTASSLGESMIAASWPGASELRTSSYGGAITAPIGSFGGSTSSSTVTNLGGVSVYVNTSGNVDANGLAEAITTKLTHQLRSAQRGGRR